jgi:hypothetical protein
MSMDRPSEFVLAQMVIGLMVTAILAGAVLGVPIVVWIGSRGIPVALKVVVVVIAVPAQLLLWFWSLYMIAFIPVFYPGILFWLAVIAIAFSSIRRSRSTAHPA